MQNIENKMKIVEFLLRFSGGKWGKIIRIQINQLNLNTYKYMYCFAIFKKLK